MSLNNLQAGVTALVIIALLAGALALALDAFQGDLGTSNMCTGTGTANGEALQFNETSRHCHNATDNTLHQGEAVTLNVTAEGLTGTANATGFLSTIGTLIGVAALIAVVVGAFYMVRR